MRRAAISLVAICMLLATPALAGQKRAFVDPTSGILKAVGYVDRNEFGDVAFDVPESFDLGPGSWRWTGAAWEQITPQLPPEEMRRLRLRDHLASLLADPAVPRSVKEAIQAIAEFLR